MSPTAPRRIDRRVAIQWMLTASAGAMLLPGRLFGAAAPARGSSGYGTDPVLVKPNKAGDYWPLLLSDEERREVAALSDTILPADGSSPSASAVGVTDFIDEWVSAPYPDNIADSKVVMGGLAWLAGESRRRHGAAFSEITQEQRTALCEEIAKDAPAGSDRAAPAAFFRLFRDLVCGGYYSTPVGMKDIGYVGNVPLAKFEGPPAELVAKLGLTDEVRW